MKFALTTGWALSLLFFVSFGGTARAEEACIVKEYTSSQSFSGRAYMLNESELSAVADLCGKLLQVNSLENSETDLDEALAIVKGLKGDPVYSDALVHEIGAYRTGLAAAIPEWERNQVKVISNYILSVEKTQAMYDGYLANKVGFGEYIAEAKASLDSIEVEVADVKVQMKVIAEEGRAYMNKVIVDEELPIPKIKEFGEYGGFRYFGEIDRGWGRPAEGSKIFKKAKARKGKPLGHEQLEALGYQIDTQFYTYDGVEYYVGGPFFMPLTLIENSSVHYENLVELYIRFGILQSHLNDKESGLVAAKRAATKELRDKKQIAENKFEVKSAARNEEWIASTKGWLDNANEWLENPDGEEQVQSRIDYVAESTSDLKKQKTKAYEAFAERRLALFLDGIKHKKDVKLGENFDYKSSTVALVVIGTKNVAGTPVSKKSKNESIQFLLVSGRETSGGRPLSVDVKNFRVLDTESKISSFTVLLDKFVEENY